MIKRERVLLGLFLVGILLFVFSLSFVSAWARGDCTCPDIPNKKYYANTCPDGATLSVKDFCKNDTQLEDYLRNNRNPPIIKDYPPGCYCNFQCSQPLSACEGEPGTCFANGIIYGCSSPCSNACAVGAKQCSANNLSYRLCGEYDFTDPCREWSPWYSCPTGKTCSAGSCIPNVSPIIPTLTCANYSGMCGTEFSNGTANVLTCNCSVGETCEYESLDILINPTQIRFLTGCLEGGPNPVCKVVDPITDTYWNGTFLFLNFSSPINLSAIRLSYTTLPSDYNGNVIVKFGTTEVYNGPVKENATKFFNNFTLENTRFVKNISLRYTASINISDIAFYNRLWLNQGTCDAIPPLPTCTLSNCQQNQCGNWSYPGICLGSVNCSNNIVNFLPRENGCIRGGVCNSPTAGTCTYTDFQCYKNLSVYYWYNGTQIEPVTNCSKYLSEDVSTCCPIGKTCNLFSGVCVDGSSILKCDNYNSKASCEIDDLNVARNSVNNSGNCDTIVNVGCLVKVKCDCAWENGKCKGFKEIPGCSSGAKSNCTWNLIALENADCTDANRPIIARTNAVFRGTDNTLRAECVNATFNYPCASSASLPFFSFFNLIFSLVIISVVYFIAVNFGRNKI
jgi:hypothetical protein